MSYEIINYDPVTPHRLHALLRLISRLEAPKKEEIWNGLQPSQIGLTNQDTSKEVMNVARNSNLVVEQPDKTLVLSVPVEKIDSVEAFRSCMRDQLLGVTKDGDSNYLFNLLTAWYAIQDEGVFGQYNKTLDYVSKVNDQLFPSVDVRRIDEKKIEGWRDWAAFVGLGWKMRTGGRGARIVLVPDATGRLEAVLDKLLPSGPPIRFIEFMQKLSDTCPELDGGQLFEYCWQLCRKGEARGNRLSLMLSNGLRGLRDMGQLELIRQADATDNWQLYSAAGDPDGQVTHIRRRENR